MKRLFTLIFLAIFLVCPSLWAANSDLGFKKKIRVATEPNWPPMEFIDENGKVDGYSIDLIKALAVELGFEVEFIAVNWEGIFPGLETEQYDIISSSVTITEERSKVFLFSKPYFEVHQAVLTLQSTDIKTTDDLQKTKIGFQTGTSSATAAQQIKGAELIDYTSIDEAILALSQGNLMAAICDYPVAASFANSPQYQDKLKISLKLENEESEKYGFVFKKNNTALKELIDGGLNQLEVKGKDLQIEKKWFNNNLQNKDSSSKPSPSENKMIENTDLNLNNDGLDIKPDIAAKKTVDNKTPVDSEKKSDNEKL